MEKSRMLVIEFDGRIETFSLNDTEGPIDVARYWIRRRIEKENNYATKAFVVFAENILDVPGIVKEIEDKHFRIAEEIQEAEERETLKKLKAKYKD